jgi:hypothetical protein
MGVLFAASCLTLEICVVTCAIIAGPVASLWAGRIATVLIITFIWLFGERLLSIWPLFHKRLECLCHLKGNGVQATEGEM